MRIGPLLLACSLVACAAACHRASNTTSVAANGPAIPHTDRQLARFSWRVRKYQWILDLDPLATDPVALLKDGQQALRLVQLLPGCHGGHGGGGMGPSLRDPVWLYGNRDDQIFDTIAHGRSHGMPAWGTKIPRQQIWELVAYIKSMHAPPE